MLSARRCRVRGAGSLVCALGLVSVIALADSGEWFLMSRHGECAPLSVLGRKNPDELSVMFVERSVCRGFIDHERSMGVPSVPR